MGCRAVVPQGWEWGISKGNTCSLQMAGRSLLFLPYPIVWKMHKRFWPGSIPVCVVGWLRKTRTKQTLLQTSSESFPRCFLPDLSQVSHAVPVLSFHPPLEASGGGRGLGRMPWRHARSICCDLQGHSGSYAGHHFLGKTPIPKQKRLFTMCLGCGISRLTHYIWASNSLTCTRWLDGKSIQ